MASIFEFACHKISITIFFILLPKLYKRAAIGGRAAMSTMREAGARWSHKTKDCASNRPKKDISLDVMPVTKVSRAILTIGHLLKMPRASKTLVKD